MSSAVGIALAELAERAKSEKPKAKNHTLKFKTRFLLSFNLISNRDFHLNLLG
jgi:hypothetical protein